MEPFLIQCDKCQTRLKVAKASLIGKRVPCPKCHVELVIPEGPEKLESNSAEAANLQGALDSNEVDASEAGSLSGFEDVDQLLSQLPAKENSSQRSPSGRSVVRPSRESPPQAPDPSDPSVSWDNPAATHTRRVLGWVATGLGASLLLAISFYAWQNQDQVVAKKDPPIQQQELDNENTDSVETVKEQEEDVDTDSDPVDGSQSIEEGARSEDPAASKKLDEPGSGASKLVSKEPPAIELSDTDANLDPTAELEIPSLVGEQTTATSEQASDSASDAGATVPQQGSNNSILKPVAPAESALSQLSALLEESGSSISAITDATSAVTVTHAIGLPKYYFEPAKSAPVDIHRQLRQPCAGLRYNDVSIVDIIRDVTVITGVPITIDTQLIPRRADQDRLIPEISINVNGTDFMEAIEAIAQQAGWTASQTETGVLLTGSDSTSIVRNDIDLTPIMKLGDQGLDGVVESIKVMIANESWFSDTASYQIDRDGATLIVQHLPSVMKQVKHFVNRIEAAIKLNETASDDRHKLVQAISTRLDNAGPNLEKSCELNVTSRTTLDDLLERIRSKTGVEVVANWETLSALGWTPQMTVPGNASEPTLDEMLRQIERATESTAIVLDSETVELTSPIDAMERSYVEFYLIEDLLKRNFTPDRTLQLVQEAIQKAAQPAASTTIYEPQCRCVILSAPQATHRVVQTVLRELRRLN